ncbi:MAG: hypothetical protein ACAI35_16810, partial [Candidatus Methylacidiphilales bacterium]
SAFCIYRLNESTLGLDYLGFSTGGLLSSFEQVPACTTYWDRVAFLRQGPDDKTLLTALEYDGRKWLEDVGWPEPAGLKWQDNGFAQCWPGSDFHVLLGDDQVVLAKMRFGTRDPIAPLRIGALIPKGLHMRIGRDGHILGERVPSGPLRDHEISITDFWVFDARRGDVLPEVKDISVPDQARSESELSTQARRTIEFVSQDNPLLKVTATQIGRTFSLHLKVGDLPAEILEPKLSVGYEKNWVRAAFSRDGKYLSVATAYYYFDRPAKPIETELTVWDVASRQPLVIRQIVGAFGVKGDLYGFFDVAAMCFGEDASTLCLVDAYGHVLMWDWQRRMPCSELLGPAVLAGVYSQNRLHISALEWKDGKVSFNVSDGSKAHRCTHAVGFPGGTPASVEKLTQLVTVLTGLQLDDNGNLIQLPEPEVPRGVTIRELRAKWKAENGTDAEALFCRWFLQDRATRPVYPGATQTVPDLFEVFLKAGQFDEASLLTFGDNAKIERIRKAMKPTAVSSQDTP